MMMKLVLKSVLSAFVVGCATAVCEEKLSRYSLIAKEDWFSDGTTKTLTFRADCYQSSSMGMWVEVSSSKGRLELKASSGNIHLGSVTMTGGTQKRFVKFKNVVPSQVPDIKVKLICHKGHKKDLFAKPRCKGYNVKVSLGDCRPCSAGTTRKHGTCSANSIISDTECIPTFDHNDFNIIGRWVYLRTSVHATEETLRRGTRKTNSETKSKEWAVAVTSSVESGLSIKGLGGTQVKLSAESSFSYATSYSQEWSSSEETEEKVFFSRSDRGKVLWQWVFDITDPFGNEVMSKTMDFALTEGRYQPPRCQPGFSKGDTVDYQRCYPKNRLLPGFDANPPPPAPSPPAQPKPTPNLRPPPRPSGDVFLIKAGDESLCWGVHEMTAGEPIRLQACDSNERRQRFNVIRHPRHQHGRLYRLDARPNLFVVGKSLDPGSDRVQGRLYLQELQNGMTNLAETYDLTEHFWMKDSNEREKYYIGIQSGRNKGCFSKKTNRPEYDGGSFKCLLLTTELSSWPHEDVAVLPHTWARIEDSARHPVETWTYVEV